MSTYRKIHGRSIQAVTTDPSETVAEGQVWYNTTSDTFKSAINFQAWSSASPLIVGRNAMATSDGSTTAAFAAGGNPDSTEEWNGSGFSTGGALTTSRRYLSGCGTLTAGLAFGGNKAPLPTLAGDTEEYNGTSFSEQNDLNTARQFLGRAGTQTAGLAFAGTAGPGASAATEEYNGTSWSEQNDMGTARSYLSGCGTQTAGLVAGGTSNSTATEEYDGTSWSTGGTLNTGATNRSMSGLQTAGLCYGGKTGPSTFITNTENYNGTSWTNLAPVALSTGRNFAGGIGNADTSALAIGGGSGPGQTTDNEEFSSSVSVITAAAWAAGGSISTVRTNVGSTSEGSQTAAMVWGGRTGPPPSGPYTSNKSDTYDGSSFSTAPNLNTAARTRAGGGTTSAAWCAGGTQPAYINATEEFNGSSWTSVTSAPLVFFAAGTGAQTAGLIVGINSSSPPGSDAFPGISLEYDGTNWATGGSPSADRTNAGCSGTQTAGTLISGQPVPYGTRVTTIEEYDGSSWTSGGNTVVAVAEIQAGARGPQTATLITGGNTNPPEGGITTCATYDGTTASTTASMGTGRRGHGSDGGQTSGLVMTGQSAGPPANNNPNYTAAAEELTAQTTALNVKTLTQS
jgi:hypothetical protein